MLRTGTDNRTPEEKNRDEQNSSILGAIEQGKNELVELGATKKRVAAELEAVTGDLSVMKTEKEALAKEISDMKKARETETQSLFDFKEEMAVKRVDIIAAMPDEKAAIDALEAKKAPIQSEINRLSKIQFDAQDTLKFYQKKVSEIKVELEVLSKQFDAKKAEFASITTDVEARKVEFADFESKKAELQILNDGIENRKVFLSNLNKQVVEREVDLTNANNACLKAAEELGKTQAQAIKEKEEMDVKARNLQLLEQRVDTKIDLFKQYKDKFSVDELARMKIDTNL